MSVAATRMPAVTDVQASTVRLRVRMLLLREHAPRSQADNEIDPTTTPPTVSWIHPNEKDGQMAPEQIEVVKHTLDSELAAEGHPPAPAYHPDEHHNNPYFQQVPPPAEPKRKRNYGAADGQLLEKMGKPVAEVEAEERARREAENRRYHEDPVQSRGMLSSVLGAALSGGGRTSHMSMGGPMMMGGMGGGGLGMLLGSTMGGVRYANALHIAMMLTNSALAGTTAASTAATTPTLWVLLRSACESRRPGPFRSDSGLTSRYSPMMGGGMGMGMGGMGMGGMGGMGMMGRPMGMGMGGMGMGGMGRMGGMGGGSALGMLAPMAMGGMMGGAMGSAMGRRGSGDSMSDRGDYGGGGYGSGSGSDGGGGYGSDGGGFGGGDFDGGGFDGGDGGGFDF